MNNFILLLLAQLFALSVLAQDFTENGLRYRTNTVSRSNMKNLTLLGPESTENLAEHLVIPEKVRDLTVSHIGEFAFNDCSKLKSIQLPASLQSIGESAFNYCSKLKSIQLPASLQSIGESAFYSCSSLTQVDLPSNIKHIGDGAFTYCKSLKSFKFPDTIKDIPNMVLFYCESLERVTLPRYLETIGYSAFSKSKIKEFDLPSTLSSIGSPAFSGCENLQSIRLPEGLKSLGTSAFSQCKSLTQVDIPKSITSLGEFTFYWCSQLDTIILPPNITSIGDACFNMCSNLKHISLPHNLNSLGEMVFYCCGSLTSIQLPDNLKTIGDECFINCSNLSSVNIPEGLETFSHDTFENCSSLENFVLPPSVISTYGLFNYEFRPPYITSYTDPKKFHNFTKTLTVPASLVEEYKKLNKHIEIKAIGNKDVILHRVADKSYATFYAYSNYQLPPDVDAYTAELHQHSLRLTKIPSRIVPGLTPVFLISDECITRATLIEKDTKVVKTQEDFILTGTCIGRRPWGTKDYFLGVKNGVLGMYHSSKEDYTLQPNRAMLYRSSLPENFDIQKLSIVIDSTPTDIDNVEPSQAAPTIYDLQGRLITQPQAGRLYIINGQTTYKYAP